MNTNLYDGYTESPHNTNARRAHIDAWVQQRALCAEIVAEVAPALDTLLDAMETIDTTARPLHLEYRTFDDLDGSDTSMSAQLRDAGFGSGGVM